jgi:hypothetical protein
VKRRTERKYRSACKMTLRERDKFDRAYVLYFMRQCIEVLAREDVGVDQKVQDVAAIARRLAPAVMTRRAALKESEDK